MYEKYPRHHWALSIRQTWHAAGMSGLSSLSVQNSLEVRRLRADMLLV